MLLSLLMLFSLAACGEDSGGGGGGGSTAPPEGYDAEYTIVIDGSDSWTPFSDGSNVSFETADSGVISTSDDGKMVTFTGLAVGETTITAAYGDKTAKALVKVVKRSASESDDDGGGGGQTGEDNAEFTGEYVYSPPSDNYCIGYQYYQGFTLLLEHIGGKIGGSFAYYINDTESGRKGWYMNVDEAGKLYEYDYLTDNRWEFIEGSEASSKSLYQPTNELQDSELYDIGAFSGALEYLSYGNEATKKRLLNKYYAGNEVICGVECWKFDMSSLDGGNIYWVDISNGCTMKHKWGDGYESTVTKYVLSYTSWTSDLVPGQFDTNEIK